MKALNVVLVLFAAMLLAPAATCQWHQIDIRNDTDLALTAVVTSTETGARLGRVVVAPQSEGFLLVDPEPNIEILVELIDLNNVTLNQAVGLITDIDAVCALDCLAGETLVRTPGGLRTLEALARQVGPVMLTGVGRVRIRETGRPSELITIQLPGEPIRATPNHLFLTMNRGWVEAESLVQGDRLRSVHGFAQVSAVHRVTLETPEPVYSIVASSDNGVPVGRLGVTSHAIVGPPATKDEVLVPAPERFLR